MARRKLQLNSGKPRNRYRSARETRAKSPQKRESLGDVFRRAKRVSERKANIRRGRRNGMMSRAAIAESPGGFELGFDELNAWQRFKSWAKALCLTPFILLVLYTLAQPAADENFMYHFWRSEEFLFFGVGVILMLGWFWTRLFSEHFLFFYVLGHELTHALFVILSFGRVTDLKVSVDGGYILTNKSNILIALSPYFIPFWSLVVLSVSGFIVAWKPIPHGDDILLLLLGGTWCFHVVWTLWMIPRDQPDLQEHGTIFSLSIIVLANLMLLSVMACLTSPDLSLYLFVSNLYNNGRDVVEFSAAWLANF